MAALAAASFAFLIGGNIASALCRFALPRHLERKFLEFALTIVVASTANSIRFRFRSFGGGEEVTINLQKGAMTKRNTFSGGRGHASQEEEDEARDCRAKRHGVFDNSKLLLAETGGWRASWPAAQRKRKEGS